MAKGQDVEPTAITFAIGGTFAIINHWTETGENRKLGKLKEDVTNCAYKVLSN